MQLPLRVAATPRRRTWRDALVARKKQPTVRLLRWPGRRGVAFALCDEGVAATVATASAFNCMVPV